MRLHCCRARVVLLGPLTPKDMDSASFVHMRSGGALQESIAVYNDS